MTLHRSLRAPDEPKRWVLRALSLNRLTYRQGSRQVDVPSLHVRNLGDASLAPFNTSVTLTRQGEPQSLQLDGALRFDIDARNLVVEPLNIVGDLGDGTCRATMRLNPAPPAPVATPEDALIDLNEWREVGWQGECHFSHLLWRGMRFETVALDSRNDFGDSHHSLEVGNAFGGSADLVISIADETPGPRWTLQPTLTDIDAVPLMVWLRQTSGWTGRFSLDGELNLRGNRPQALQGSAIGRLNLISHDGSFDIREAKQQALAASQLFGASSTVAKWPDTLQYQSLSGHWAPNGPEQTLALLLDNLSFAAQGRYQPDTRRPLDLDATLTFLGSAEPKPLPVNPLLEDLPLPLHCRGDLGAPNCRFDSDAGRALLGDILSGKTQGDNEASLRGKLEQRIEDEVPEQWQDAARSLLDLLGESLRKRAD